MPVAERVTVETLSTTELVLARRPAVSADATLTEMTSAVVGAGKMTVSTAMAAAAVTTPVATSMAAASAVAAAMTAAAMTATAMTATAVTTTLAPRNIGRQSQRSERNGHC